MPVSDSEHRAALTRAGDASAAEAVACRERARAESARDIVRDMIDATWEATGLPQVARDTLPLDESVRDIVTALREARAVIAAARAALGASATGDLAADVARVMDAWGVVFLERAAAEATLRETTIALERVTREHDDVCAAHLAQGERWRVEVAAAEERGVRAGLEAAAARLETGADCDVHPDVRRALREAATHVRALDAASIAARIETPPVEAAAEPPHRTGDTWRDSSGYEHTVARVADDGARIVLADDAGTGSAGFLEWSGLRRVRCAPAVGDAVRVGDAVGVVARLPEAPLQGVRVDGPGDRMTIAEAGELEALPSLEVGARVSVSAARRGAGGLGAVTAIDAGRALPYLVDVGRDGEWQCAAEELTVLSRAAACSMCSRPGAVGEQCAACPCAYPIAAAGE